MTKSKVYIQFNDVFDTVYTFKTYTDFILFWFSQKRKNQIAYFPDFKTLNHIAMHKRSVKNVCTTNEQ